MNMPINPENTQNHGSNSPNYGNELNGYVDNLALMK